MSFDYKKYQQEYQRKYYLENKKRLLEGAKERNEKIKNGEYTPKKRIKIKEMNIKERRLQHKEVVERVNMLNLLCKNWIRDNHKDIYDKLIDIASKKVF